MNKLLTGVIIGVGGAVFIDKLITNHLRASGHEEIADMHDNYWKKVSKTFADEAKIENSTNNSIQHNDTNTIDAEAEVVSDK